ncbi:hypothetical protein [Candidatus Albibeggiatoa sp. nov. BB20]|uniref:hypothetical protein n=1 Tax=Candidatus Albibeggiatoa sp. nov. BB20 TaxID=3162723 RepID=UPI0033658197
MLYLTKTDTRLTCVASQRSFMSIVWYTAKAMNGKPIGSKAYLKQATAFVQSWNKKACTGGIFHLVPVKSRSHVDLTTSHQQSLVDTLFAQCLPYPFPKLSGVFSLKAPISFGFFSYPVTLFKQANKLLLKIQLTRKS